MRRWKDDCDTFFRESKPRYILSCATHKRKKKCFYICQIRSANFTFESDSNREKREKEEERDINFGVVELCNARRKKGQTGNWFPRSILAEDDEVRLIKLGESLIKDVEGRYIPPGRRANNLRKREEVIFALFSTTPRVPLFQYIRITVLYMRHESRDGRDAVNRSAIKERVSPEPQQQYKATSAKSATPEVLVLVLPMVRRAKFVSNLMNNVSSRASILSLSSQADKRRRVVVVINIEIRTWGLHLTAPPPSMGNETTPPRVTQTQTVEHCRAL